MTADSKSPVRALIDERRAAEKEIERLRLEAHAIACAMANAATVLSRWPERLALPGMAPDSRFDEPGSPVEIAGVERIGCVVRDLRAAILRERDARGQLRDLGIDLEKIEDELLAAKSRALHRAPIAGADEKPDKSARRHAIGFSDRKGK